MENKLYKYHKPGNIMSLKNEQVQMHNEMPVPFLFISQGNVDAFMQNIAPRDTAGMATGWREGPTVTSALQLAVTNYVPLGQGPSKTPAE